MIRDPWYGQRKDRRYPAGPIIAAAPRDYEAPTEELALTRRRRRAQQRAEDATAAQQLRRIIG